MSEAQYEQTWFIEQYEETWLIEQYEETWFIVPSHILDLPGLTLSALKVHETIYQFQRNNFFKDINMSDEQYKETWFIVPSHILDLPGLTLSALKVFETIYQFWNKSRQCFLSNPEIARRTGVKLTQIQHAMAFFEKFGELERIQIGMKRYLIQPIKAVEIPRLAIVPKQVALNQATCTTSAQVPRNRAPCTTSAQGTRNQVPCTTSAQVPCTTSAQGIRNRVGGYPKSDREGTRNRIPEIKNLNKENKRSNTKDNVFILEALKNNPHNLTLEIIQEWDEIRTRKHKAPLTQRAWERTNNVLTTLIGKGLRLPDIIDRMLTAEWRGLELHFFDKELQAVNKTPVIRGVDDAQLREQLKQQAIEREQKEQAAKEQERREAPNIMKRLKVSMLERMAQHEAEVKRLGMNGIEYHEYITKNQAELPEVDI